MFILDEYVNPDTARLMREKGFKQITDCWYDEENQIHVRGNYSYSGQKVFYEETCVNAPTQQVAMRWLREIHHVHIYAFHTNATDMPEWCFEVDKMDENLTYSKHHGNTYEECIEDAIKYACTNCVNNADKG